MDRNQSLKEEFIAAWRSGMGIRVYTSGSTGSPKDIVLPHNQIVRSAFRTVRFFSIDQGSHLHSAVSFEYIGGKMMIARSLLAGCKLSFQPPSLRPEAPEEMITLMSVVPAQMASILSRKEEFRHVCNFLIGGSAISLELWREIANSGLTAYESYGMTETASHIALRKIEGDRPSDVPFRLLPGIDVSLDKDGSLIIVDDDITVKTNDLAQILPDGGLIIKGRIDDMIVTGGKKVLPQNIEIILAEHIDFQGHRFMIDSLSHPVWTNEIILVVEDIAVNDDFIDYIQSAVNSIPEAVLQRWQRPKRYVKVKGLPVTSSGKIKRKSLNNLLV